MEWVAYGLTEFIPVARLRPIRLAERPPGDWLNRFLDPSPQTLDGVILHSCSLRLAYRRRSEYPLGLRRNARPHFSSIDSMLRTQLHVFRLAPESGPQFPLERRVDAQREPILR